MGLFDFFNKSGAKMKKIKQELDNFSDSLKDISGQIVFEQLKQRIIVLLSNNPEVETSKYSAQKITYTMLANICNALFIRHRIYPTNFTEKSIIEIWKLAVKRLYGFNEITETEYNDTINHINSTVSECLAQHKSAFEDDRDDMLNNPLFSGQWWF